MDDDLLSPERVRNAAVAIYGDRYWRTVNEYQQHEAAAQKWKAELTVLEMAATSALMDAEMRALDAANRGLLSEAMILAACVPAVAVGIYFLVKDGRVVYVGQSTNFHARIITHRREKDFDSYTFMPCEATDLNRLESLYIHVMAPPLNAVTGPHGAKLAPMRMLDASRAQEDLDGA